MPAVFLDRLPLPSLQVYAVGSVLLLACSIHYAVQVITTAEFESQLNPGNGTAAATGEYRTYRNSTIGVQRDIIVLDIGDDEGLILARILQVLHFMLQEPMCIWTLINMAYCCFILVGKTIQKLVFGDLRVSEQQHIKDKFWNFVFYKFIFIFGVMNVQYMDEVVLWCSWFSMLGFLHLLAQLCKDRCEYLSFSPATPKWTHCRVLTLLVGILTISLCLFGLCAFVGYHAGINTFAFMAAENSLVTIRTLYVIVRYSAYLCDVRHKGTWEKRASYIYYSELIFELLALSIDFLHHLHMLVWGNIFLSMASLVIAMQLRCLFYEIRHRIKKYSNYLRIVKYMEFNYPMASSIELDSNNDDCAICWDHLDSARKLPCGHLFHNSCLRSWLEQDTSCPTCRKSLNDSVEKSVSDYRQRDGALPGLSLQDNFEENSGGQTTNHFFHFDGSRYISWLPSFFVEVSHTSGIAERQMSTIQSSQLEHMAHQVQQMFPHMPLSVILDDLRTSKSIESTVENIVEGKLVAPPGNRNQSGSNIQASDYNQSAAYLGGQRENMMCSDQLNFIEDAVLSPDVYTDVIDDISRFTSTMRSAPPLGCRFSKSPEEREQMLAERKESLIKIAKRKYLEKRQTQNKYLSINQD